MKLALEIDGFDACSDERDQELQEIETLIEHCGDSVEILNSAWGHAERRDFILHVYSQEAGDTMKKIKEEMESRGYEVSIEEETFV